MSTSKQSSGRRPRYARRARYTRFQPVGPGEAGRAAARHMDWLQANLDWFALSGRATLHTASLALQRGLKVLADPELNRPSEQEEAAAEANARETVEQQAQQIAELSHRLETVMRYGETLGWEFFDFAGPESCERDWQAQKHYDKILHCIKIIKFGAHPRVFAQQSEQLSSESS